MPLPELSAELIRLLDKWYPERSPNPQHTDREIWMQAGQRELVRKLLAQRDAQEKKQ